MKKIRVPFPRYLNSKKLINRWEYDIVYVSVGVGFVSLFIITWITTNILISLVISGLMVKFTMKKYIKFFKKTRRGYFKHMFYSYGYLSPMNKEKIKFKFEESLIPYGFENEFKN